MTISRTVLVTDGGVIAVSDREMRTSGAKFSKLGRPVNLEARVLMDIAHHMTFDDFMERNRASFAGAL